MSMTSICDIRDMVAAVLKIGSSVEVEYKETSAILESGFFENFVNEMTWIPLFFAISASLVTSFVSPEKEIANNKSFLSALEMTLDNK